MKAAIHIIALASAMLFHGIANADIFKCARHHGAAIYSDDTCGPDAKLIQTRDAMAITANVMHGDGRRVGTVAEVNGVPAMFVIDTGAAVTSIPSAMGKAAGLSACEPRRFDTANGMTDGCVAKANIMVNGIKVEQIDVAVLPNLSHPLLGMNAISRLGGVFIDGSLARFSRR